MIIDLAIGQVATFLAQLDQHLEAVTASFLLFGSQAARGDVFFSLRTLGTALWQRLEFGNDLAIDNVIDEIIGGLIGVLCRPPRPAPGGFGGAHGGCLLPSTLLRRSFLGSRFFHGGFLGSLLGGSFGGGATCRINVFPHLHRERIRIAGRCYSLGFLGGFI